MEGADEQPSLEDISSGFPQMTLWRYYRETFTFYKVFLYFLGFFLSPFIKSGLELKLLVNPSERQVHLGEKNKNPTHSNGEAILACSYSHLLS